MYHVVIAEDEHWIRRGLAEMVNRTDGRFKVVGEAGDGREAWTLIQERSPSLLITDIEMPRKDGLSLIKDIDEARVPVVSIVVSGYDNFDYARQGVRYGVSEYLLKPVREETLLEALERSVYRLELLHPVHEQQMMIQSFLEHLSAMDNHRILKEQSHLVQAIAKNSHIHPGSKLGLLRIFAGRWENLLEADFPDYARLPETDGTEEALRQRLQRLGEEWARRNGNQMEKRSFRLVIRQACEHAEKHYMQELTLAAASRQAGLSASHFSALFKQHTGDSYVNYINRLRIDKAKQLLLEPDLKIYQVAEMVGFSSIPYFTRLFKTVAGMSPNEYRKGMGI